MKIAYLSKTPLSDVDFSYVHTAQELCDIDMFIEITPRYLKGAAICLDKCNDKCGVFKALEIYPQFARFANVMDLNKCYVVNTPGKYWVMKAIWTNILFLFFLIKKKYKIVHVTWPLNIQEFVLFFLRRRMVLTIHDPFPHTGSGNFVELARRWFSFRFIKNFIILNEAQKHNFSQAHNIPMERIYSSSLGCYSYLNYVKGVEIKDLPEKYILFFGSISQYKGLEYLFPSMIKVHEKHPDYHLVICGKGSFHFDISLYLKYNYFHFYNRFIKDEELVTFIKKASFVICPYTDATQSGVIMSAYAFKKPVIATNVGGLPEMVKNGELGLIIEEKNIDELVNAINYYIENPQKREEHSSMIGKTYFQGEKSWKKIAAELRVIYSKL